MEHPLQASPYCGREYLALARALLACDQTLDAHAQVLAAAFDGSPPGRRLSRLASRTLTATSLQPRPRLKALVRTLQEDGLLRKLVERHPLRPAPAVQPHARMRPFSGARMQVALESVGELADWLRLEPDHLLWFADLRDLNRSAAAPSLGHYTRRILAKPLGSIRLLEAPKQRLRSIQRQIYEEILAPISLHPAVHGFAKGRSILTFVSPHVNRQVVMRVDLQDFFPTLSGPRIQALFRTLGYPEQVADLLGGLCTTTTPRDMWRQTGLELAPTELQRARTLYARPHLPQGAPTSPALANLCAFRLDCRLTALAKRAGAAYTRYADDLAFSGDANLARRAGRFLLHVLSIVTQEGFTPHPRKSRVMRPAVRQHLAGLTVNVQPNLPRREWDLLEATLTNCMRQEPATQNRSQHHDFRRHLEGRVAFATMVNPVRSAPLRALLLQIAWPAEPIGKNLA